MTPNETIITLLSEILHELKLQRPSSPGSDFPGMPG